MTFGVSEFSLGGFTGGYGKAGGIPPAPDEVAGLWDVAQSAAQLINREYLGHGRSIARAIELASGAEYISWFLYQRFLLYISLLAIESGGSR